MRSRDPETGEVFVDISHAVHNFCLSGKTCSTCGLPNCVKYSQEHPAEAARLMGLEVVDEPMSDTPTTLDDTPTTLDDTPTTLDDTPTVSGDTPTKEDNMEKLDKPRLAEVLGVEVGEKFQVSGWEDGNGGYWIDENGDIDNTTHAGISIIMLVDIINHPESIIHLPRLTEAELAICKAVGAKWVSKADGDPVWAELWDVEPKKTSVGLYHTPGVDPITRTKAKFFPSVKPGDLVEVPE